jgi:hypothetical protein
MPLLPPVIKIVLPESFMNRSLSGNLSYSRTGGRSMRIMLSVLLFALALPARGGET